MLNFEKKAACSVFYSLQRELLYSYKYTTAAAPIYLLMGLTSGEAVCLKEAFAYAVAGFAVFNLQYPPAMPKTFLFIEKIILGIEDTTTVKTREYLKHEKAVVSLVAKMNGMNSRRGKKKNGVRKARGTMNAAKK